MTIFGSSTESSREPFSISSEESDLILSLSSLFRKKWFTLAKKCPHFFQKNGPTLPQKTALRLRKKCVPASMEIAASRPQNLTYSNEKFAARHGNE